MVILNYEMYIFNQMVFRIDILRQKEDLQQPAYWNTSAPEISGTRGNTEQCKYTVAIIVLCERDLSALLTQCCSLYYIVAGG